MDCSTDETTETEAIDQIDTTYSKRNLETADSYSDTEKSDNPQPNEISDHAFPAKEPEFHSIGNIVVAIMESEVGFSFCGKLSVKVLYGAIEVYGATLNATKDAKEIYSPNGYSNVVIQASKEFPEGDIKHVRASLSFYIALDSKTKLQADLDKIQPGTAIVLLKTFQNTLTKFLNSNWPFKLFPVINNSGYYSFTSRERAETVLQCNLYFAEQNNSTQKPLIVNPKIKNIAENMLSRWRSNEWSCTLIAGGKDVGKSTSTRCLINTLLSMCEKVVLLDVDPGQTECTPASCLSYSLIEEPLLGPNFTHQKTPVYQVFIDEINISQCPLRYLKGVKMLIQKLKECPVLSRLPIVVNTMGYVEDIGWDLMIFTIKLIRPSTILQIKSNKSRNNYKFELTKKTVNDLRQEFLGVRVDRHFLNWSKHCDHDFYTFLSYAEDTVAETNKCKMQPYEQRELVMISYFSDIAYQNNSHICWGKRRWDERTKLDIYKPKPYTAPLSSLVIIPPRLYGVPVANALGVINGNIVALCGIDLPPEESAKDLPSEESAKDLPPEESAEKSKNVSGPIVLMQREPLCTCYGFGIIHGVDSEHIYINTPMPLSMMKHVNCLSGSTSIPPALLDLRQGAPYVGRDLNIPTSRQPRKKKFRKRRI